MRRKEQKIPHTAFLTIDVPDNCNECPLLSEDEVYLVDSILSRWSPTCVPAKRMVETDYQVKRPRWCPLEVK